MEQGGIQPDSPELGVVIPFRNEEDSLPLLLAQLEPQLRDLGCSYEAILVDDGSEDRGWAWLKAQKRRWPELALVRLTRGFGKEGAIRAGLEASRASAVIVMDADLQHPVDLIPVMYKRWRETTTWVVEGVKAGAASRGPFGRLAAPAFFHVSKKMTNLDLRNRSDFQLLDRRAIRLFLALPERITVFRGILAWLGLPTEKVSFEVPPRAAGKTQWSVRNRVGLALDVVTGFTNSPLRLMTYASMLFGTFSVLLGIQTLYMYLSGQAVEGFTTVILVVLITGTALSIGLGIIGEYLARIYEEVKARPQFVVEEVIPARRDPGEIDKPSS